MKETQALAVTLTAEEEAAIKEIARNYLTGRQVWKILVKLGAFVTMLAGFGASLALIWQSAHWK